MGGDQTIKNTTISIDGMATYPLKNPVAFFTGEDGFADTRLYSQWLQNDTIQVEGKEYDNVGSVSTYYYSPWESAQTLDGTDGIQFSPELDKDSIVSAFVSELSRNCYFEFRDTDTSSYSHFDIMIFGIQDQMFQNFEENADNANYEIFVTGTSNLTTTLNANAFISKGHYYQLQEDAKSSTCTIID